MSKQFYGHETLADQLISYAADLTANLSEADPLELVVPRRGDRVTGAEAVLGLGGPGVWLTCDADGESLELQGSWGSERATVWIGVNHAVARAVGLLDVIELAEEGVC